MEVGLDIKALEERYNSVRAQLPAHVKLIAVSKRRTVAEIQALYDLGHRRFGESYPQELRDKQPRLPTDIEWHFIGHLQTNKVRYVVPTAHLVQTVDGEKILDVIQKHAGKSGRKVEILFQVHIAREETKHGMTPIEAEELFNNWDILRWPSIVPKGLMAMASNTDDMDIVRSEYRFIKQLRDKMVSGPIDRRIPLSELSMGMSGDAQIAIQEGSTMIRIGTAIFGER